MKIEVDVSDLQKIRDILFAASKALSYRDGMNAEIHLAKEVRFSPLTAELVTSYERLERLLKDKQ